MGLDRRLFISHNWDVSDVLDTVRDAFDPEAQIVPTEVSPDYQILRFTTNGETRGMHVFRSASMTGGFSGIRLDLNAYGQSEHILRTLAKRLGGFYQHEDSAESYEAYQSPFDEGSNHMFYLKQAAKRGLALNKIDPKFEYEQEKARKEIAKTSTLSYHNKGEE